MKLIITALLIVVGIFAWLSNNDVTVETTATGTIKYTDDFKVYLTQTESIFDAFMIFGGHLDKKLHNSISDYSFGALEIGEAAAIKRKYPDFHRCKSPGASIAQRKILNLSLIAENQQTADILEDAIALHDERLSGDNERVCVELRGYQVEPTTILLKENDMDISKDIIPSLRNMDFYLISGAEIRECHALM
ncbi:MAG: hypothetical protein PVI92_11950 [Chromatiales bacterium]|jgi:hypothetical protein